MDEDKVQKERREQDEKSTAQRAGILGIPYLDTRGFENTIILAEGALDIATMRQNHIVPLIIGNNEQPWRFGITTQTPQSYIGELTKQYNENGHNINFFLISLSSFDVFINRFDPVIKVVHEDIKIARDGDSNTIDEVSKTLNSVGSDEIFDYLIDQADKLGASDIHIENGRTNMRIRMRIDGVLHPVADLNSDRYRMILAALATRANISTASTEPQSGHIQKEITVDGKTHILNLRAETIPTMYGQDAVLRLFNYDESSLNLDRLGISTVERRRLDEIISHPRGMVLMVGPTGSGKTTTLYSIINALNTTARKIITLEDPVEYSISGISQIPVNTTGGQSFGDNLRSVLRLDPDVLMIGEIRDADTAKTAVQASITGHLVLSSFHATSSAAAFSRMIDMIGVNPIFSSAIRLVIAQRLVRRLDDATKEEYEPDDATKRWVQNVLNDLPENSDKPDLNNFKLWRPVINEQSPFGYKGRVVIMEQMVITDKIQRFLSGDESEMNPEVIEKAAKEEGMITLLQRGVLAALRGETTLEEVNRVI